MGLRNQYRGTWGWPDPAVQSAFLLFNRTIDQVRPKVLEWVLNQVFMAPKGAFTSESARCPSLLWRPASPSQHMSCDPSRVGLCAPTDVPPASLPKAGARPRLRFAFALGPHKRRPVKKTWQATCPPWSRTRAALTAAPPSGDLSRWGAATNRAQAPAPAAIESVPVTEVSAWLGCSRKSTFAFNWAKAAEWSCETRDASTPIRSAICCIVSSRS